MSSQLQQKSNIQVDRDKMPANASAPRSRGEMTFDCGICMEFNEQDVVVATECGHVFHKSCVAPWIQQTQTCPSCRVRATLSSLRKIFASVSSRNEQRSVHLVD